VFPLQGFSGPPTGKQNDDHVDNTFVAQVKIHPFLFPVEILISLDEALSKSKNY
jgi:hypothetical protein